MQNPLLQHWTNIAIGKSNFHLSASVNSRDNSINIWLNIMGAKAKENYEKLYEISFENSLKEVSHDLVWDKMEGRKMCAVMLKASADFTNRADWSNQFEWYKEHLEKYTKYFKPRIVKI